MKIQKHIFLYCLIPLFTIILLNGCSDDDEPIPQTFLEKYDGTKWVNNDEPTIYLRLNYNTNKPLEQWVSLSDCYYYEFGNIEIIENSTNKLVVQVTDDGEIETLTFTIEGDVLTIVITELDGFETVSLIKTSVNVDDFEICDLGDFTYVPDDNFEKKLIDLGYDDVLDDYVKTINITDVNKLDVRDLEIKDLTGIEDFEKLEVLDCRSNELKELNVSNNTSLHELWCNENQLTKLDVSNNTSLRFLYCFENQITSLDVSNNTSLSELWCWDNPISSLDVSNNSDLWSLSCGGNQLTSIDVSNNTNLRRLSCSFNQITSLDVSNNTFLYSLDCSFNQLTSLNVSNNISLTNLYFYENQLTSLDVSMNTSLKDLGCSSNQLTSLDVSNNSSLTYLKCQTNPLTCVKVNQTQMDDIPTDWEKDPEDTYSLDCN